MRNLFAIRWAYWLPKSRTTIFSGSFFLSFRCCIVACGSDEVAEQRAGLVRAALEFGMELDTEHPRVIRNFTDFYKVAFGFMPAMTRPAF
jgi:hypothetical protein